MLCNVCTGINKKYLVFKYVLIVFFRNKSVIYICASEILKAFKTGFSIHNIHLYLCWQVENTKWILCCRKMVFNVQYLRFLMYTRYCTFCTGIRKCNVNSNLLIMIFIKKIYIRNLLVLFIRQIIDFYRQLERNES